MINLNIVVPQHKSQIRKAALQRVARYCLRHNHVRPFSTELTITITTVEEIQELNKNYRQTDAPTDVLSFETQQIDPETGRNYLGDVVISFPTANDQAIIAGHNIEVELALLTIHGILHLLGYDHGTEADKQTMWKVQDQIFRKLHIHPKQLPEN